MRMQEADPLLLRNDQNRTPIGKQVERERTQEKDDSEKGDEGAAEGPQTREEDPVEQVGSRTEDDGVGGSGKMKQLDRKE